MLTNEQDFKDTELTKKESMEGPALLDMDSSFKSNRTEKTQEGGAQNSSNDLEEVTEKPDEEENLRNSMKKSKIS